MASSVEQIKERLSIVDVVGAHVKLEKAGANLKARCPFHSEKTASFFVSPVRNSYYCFGCGAKGDVFSFIQAFEGVDFLGALKNLADRAGVVLTRENPQVSDERAKLLAVLEEATIFYEQGLEKDKAAQEYLRGRGIADGTVTHFRLGYARPQWRELHGCLKEKGFPDRLLALSGLIKDTERGQYDLFRGRIMFPLMDSSGRVVAFSGRVFGDRGALRESEKTEPSKYVNSPETPLYSKSKVLYGFDKAKDTIRKHDFSIVVEGQMDLVMSHQAGYTNTVALSGTALTAPQVTMLSRLSTNSVFAFDADRAGILSSGRSAELALSMGMNVKVTVLPKGIDPADLIAKDPDAWKQVIRQAKHIIDFYLDVLSDTGDLRAYRLAVQETVLPFVARIGNKIDQAHFVSRIASRLNLDERPIWEELRKVPMSGKSAEAISAGATDTNRSVLPRVVLSRRDLIGRRLAGILLWQEAAPAPALDTGVLRARIIKHFGDLFTSISEEVAHELLFEAEVMYSEREDLLSDVEELVRQASLEALRSELTKATNELRRAEEEKAEERIQSLLAHCKKLSAELAALASVTN